MTAAMCGVLCISGVVLTTGFYGTVILTLLLLLCTAGVALRLLKNRAEKLAKELKEEKEQIEIDVEEVIGRKINLFYGN